MDVVLRNVRHIEVDDVLELLDVDAARHDVGGHQAPIPPGLEAVEGLRALCLRPIPVDLGVGYAFVHEIVGKTVRTMLGPREDNDVADITATHQLDEQRGLELFAHRVDGLPDADGGR